MCITYTTVLEKEIKRTKKVKRLVFCSIKVKIPSAGCEDARNIFLPTPLKVTIPQSGVGKKSSREIIACH